MRALLDTSLGPIEVDLFEADTPKTVSNFAELARSQFYSNLVFHRIVRGFVIQTGDPTTKNAGGNRSRWGMVGSSKTVPLEVVPSLHNETGTLGIARSQDPNSGSSQFYINLTNNSQLDRNYTVFGKVTNGMDTVSAIGNLAVDEHNAPIDSTNAMLRSITLS
jgi:cyclophilin family peptidyl-prolyl cis-trans isomerase